MDNLSEPDQQLIKDLRGSSEQHDRALWKLCSDRELRNAVLKTVKYLNGNEVDAEDVFFESIAALAKNIAGGRFRADSTIKTYFLNICKNIYLKKYRRNTMPLEEKQLSDSGQTAADPVALMIEADKEREMARLFATLLSEVSDSCKKLLRLKIRQASMEVIREELGYKNIQSAKNQYGRCRKSMRELIDDNATLKNAILEIL